MAPLMARCRRVKRSSGESCREVAFAFYGAIKLVLLLPLIASVLYAQPASPVQQLMFRPYHASGLIRCWRYRGLDCYSRSHGANVCV